MNVRQKLTPERRLRYNPAMLNRLRQVPADERRAAFLSLGVGIALLGIKFGAYALTRSTAVFTDALEGVVNVAAAFFAAYALSVAHQPADKDHPYGHGKVEFLSAGFEGGMILIAAIVSTGKAVDSLLGNDRLETTRLDFGVLLLVIALIANGLLGVYLVRLGKRRQSITLEADGWHLLGDAVTSTAALAALIAVRFTGIHQLDPIAAILVSLYIAYTGFGLVRRSSAGLMDEQDKSDDRLLRGILDTHIGPAAIEPRICSYHKLRHRHSGRYHWVDFHLVVPRWWDVDKGHRVASSIEYEIEQALREGNATAHVEPCKSAECGACSPTAATVS